LFLTLDELFVLLQKFNIDKSRVHPQLGDVDKLYSKFMKEHYLARNKMTPSQEFDRYQLTWGSRARLEISMVHMADAMAEIMGIEKTSLFINQLERASGLEGVFELETASTTTTQETMTTRQL
jgi:hypothetical protein